MDHGLKNAVCVSGKAHHRQLHGGGTGSYNSLPSQSTKPKEHKEILPFQEVAFSFSIFHLPFPFFIHSMTPSPQDDVIHTQVGQVFSSQLKLIRASSQAHTKVHVINSAVVP